MAGMGKRMRPHTLTTAKPLIPIAGKPIVERLCNDIARVCKANIANIAFVTGEFGEKVEEDLIKIATNLGAKGHICKQSEALGTGHAVMCARAFLNNDVIIAFADTLFKADFDLDHSSDGTIWVHKVENPSSFGVVKLDQNNIITDFIEKPPTFVSDLAIIGIYHFTDGQALRTALQYLLDNNIMEKGEYQLTNALENLKKAGARFKTGAVSEWLDCGNKDATVYTNQRIIVHNETEFNSHNEARNFGENNVIINPCYIAEGAQMRNATIGPYVSIGNCSVIENSIIVNSIVMNHVTIKNTVCNNAMIGNHVIWDGAATELSISDYSTNISTKA